MASVKASLELADRILYFMDIGDTTIAGFTAGGWRGSGGVRTSPLSTTGEAPPPLVCQKNINKFLILLSFQLK